LGWRFAFARDGVPFQRLLGARVAGEALNVVTAMGSLGGEAVKAWLVRRDIAYEESVPAIIIAKTTITIAQAIFLLIGLVLARTTLALDSAVLTTMFWLLIVEVLAVGGFFGAQVAGFIARGGRLLRLFGGAGDGTYARTLDRSLRQYYGSEWRRLALSTGFHLVGWLLGAAETLLMLVVLGVTVTPLTATVLEAFGSGVRFATFLVPASLGTLEAANAGAFEAIGLGAGAGLAFSFVRRARQAVWIVVGTLVLLGMRWRDGRAETRRHASHAA
jgi:glycosyltransferase 2 family protein